MDRRRHTKKPSKRPPLAGFHWHTPCPLLSISVQSKGISECRPEPNTHRVACAKPPALRLGVQEGAAANRSLVVCSAHSVLQKLCPHYRPFRLEGSTQSDNNFFWIETGGLAAASETGETPVKSSIGAVPPGGLRLHMNTNENSSGHQSPSVCGDNDPKRASNLDSDRPR